MKEFLVKYSPPLTMSQIEEIAQEHARRVAIVESRVKQERTQTVVTEKPSTAKIPKVKSAQVSNGGE